MTFEPIHFHLTNSSIGLRPGELRSACCCVCVAPRSSPSASRAPWAFLQLLAMLSGFTPMCRHVPGCVKAQCRVAKRQAPRLRKPPSQ